MSNLGTFCGLFCGACTDYLVTQIQHFTPPVADAIRTATHTPCDGCKSNSTTSCRAGCKIADCAESHHYATCADCPDMPCSLLQAFVAQYPHHHNVVADLQRIRAIGLDAWLQEQSEQWKCSTCGAPIHWYQNGCPACGNPVSRDEIAAGSHK